MDRVEIRKKIRNYIDKTLTGEGDVIEASRYMSLNENSGLWRPLILISAAKSFGTSIERTLPIASAIELVHCSTLIEDDITDKAEIRRGKYSCHLAFGDDVAHLSQMYLVQEAYKNILKENDLSDNQRLGIARRAYKAGQEMILGQEKDISQNGLDKVDDILKMYERKSGALIGVAAASGGIVGLVFDEDVKTLDRLGRYMGVSYQIGDDLTDVLGDEKKIGKPIGQDEDKKTIVKLVGIEGARNIKKKYDKLVLQEFEKLHGDCSILGDIIWHLRGKHEKYMS
jgi:geranylgeranyl pyrophosphate synthase